MKKQTLRHNVSTLLHLTITIALRQRMHVNNSHPPACIILMGGHFSAKNYQLINILQLCTRDNGGKMQKEQN